MSESDVASTLGALERKLRELEDELQVPAPPPVARPDGASPTASWRTAVPLPEDPLPAVATAPPLEPAPPLSVLNAQELLDELLRFRTELERSTQRLMTEYERVLDALRSPVPTPMSVPPVALTRAGGPADPAPEPSRRPPATSARALDDVVMEGAVTVDAGPFGDITTLSGFQQALGAVSGVRDVYVRGFEGTRAIIDVTLARPVALGAELRRRSPVSFAVTAADAGRLSVAIDES